MELFGLTRTQIALWSFTALAVLGLGTAVADAMVETDAERLGEIARVVEQGAPRARVDGLLAWADPAREPVVLTHGRTRYRIDDGADLPDALHDVLAPLDREGAIDVMQDDVSVDGETGTVAIGARVDGERVDVRLTLRREGQSWLLSGVSAY